MTNEAKLNINTEPTVVHVTEAKCHGPLVIGDNEATAIVTTYNNGLKEIACPFIEMKGKYKNHCANFKEGYIAKPELCVYVNILKISPPSI